MGFLQVSYEKQETTRRASLRISWDQKAELCFFVGNTLWLLSEMGCSVAKTHRKKNTLFQGWFWPVLKNDLNKKVEWLSHVCFLNIMIPQFVGYFRLKKWEVGLRSHDLTWFCAKKNWKAKRQEVSHWAPICPSMWKCHGSEISPLENHHKCLELGKSHNACLQVRGTYVPVVPHKAAREVSE